MVDTETKAQAFDQIQEIMANTDSHRTRARREALDAIEAVVENAEPTEVASDGRPPLAGPQATADVWRAYAEGLGIDVPNGAKRAEIIALVDAAEEPEPEAEPEPEPVPSVTTVVTADQSA